VSEFLSALAQHRLLAVVRLRGIGAIQVHRTSAILLDAGLQILEITYDSDAALETLPRLRREFPHAWIGMGTVLDARAAAEAVEAGAQFIVTPGERPSVATAAREAGVALLPGAWTPSEVMRTWDIGCAAVKLFPCSVGGVQHVRDLRAPLPHVPLVAVGGVTLENAGAFLAAGAVALGVGSALTQGIDDAQHLRNTVQTWLEAVRGVA
jgi:2-dehydro-3-deoxyphosphogluconate aldolase / (4S)-4-hydroxy-2-oxoglutarate aldolase